MKVFKMIEMLQELDQESELVVKTEMYHGYGDQMGDDKCDVNFGTDDDGVYLMVIGSTKSDSGWEE